LFDISGTRQGCSSATATADAESAGATAEVGRLQG